MSFSGYSSTDGGHNLTRFGGPETGLVKTETFTILYKLVLCGYDYYERIYFGQYSNYIKIQIHVRYRHIKSGQG